MIQLLWHHLVLLVSMQAVSVLMMIGAVRNHTIGVNLVIFLLSEPGFSGL